MKQTAHRQYLSPHIFKTAVANTFDHEFRRVVRIKGGGEKEYGPCSGSGTDPIRTQLRTGKSRVNDYLARINALETDQMWIWEQGEKSPGICSSITHSGLIIAQI